MTSTSMPRNVVFGYVSNSDQDSLRETWSIPAEALIDAQVATVVGAQLHHFQPRQADRQSSERTMTILRTSCSRQPYDPR
jgi:hypothetical protein